MYKFGKGINASFMKWKPSSDRFILTACRCAGVACVAAQGFTGITPCSGGFELTPGRVTITAATARRLIAAAYGQPCGAALDLKLISGGPDWAPKDAFHIKQYCRRCA